MADARQPQLVTVADQSGKAVVFTATLKESPKFVVDVSEHPVEEGSNVTDHARPKLITASFEVVISDAGNPANATSAAAAQSALEFFVDLYERPRVVSIASTRLFYESMLMTSFDPPRDKTTGQAIKFTVEF